jgi:YD repeat-containing protein
MAKSTELSNGGLKGDCGLGGSDPIRPCRVGFAAVILSVLLPSAASLAQSPSFRYFYDDSAQMFRVLDSTGTLLQYTYDPNGNITQINRSTVAPSSLSILSLAPFSGTSGQAITIYGQNFRSTPSANTVMINGVAATVISASSTAIVVTVPTGATSGLVSVTVNGVTVSSGTLNFTVIGPPVITSITPPYGTIGQTLTGVVIQGANLDGAQFYLNGAGFISPVSVNSTQATVNITVGQAPGRYILTAIGNNGASTSQLTSGNAFDVYYAPGNNTVNLLVTVLNTAGPTPGIPTGSNQVDTNFSVLNSAGPTPGIPPGSNEADELFSTMNTADPPTRPTSISLAPARGGAKRPGLTQGLAQGTVELCAGQTVLVSVNPPVLTRRIELEANGASLATSTTGTLTTLLTAPFGIDSMDLKAVGFANTVAVPASSPQHLRFCVDPGQRIVGRATGQDGQPLPGAVVTWQAQGLAAEYFRFDREGSGLPDLSGLKPDRTGYVTALNFPNPQGVFGQDPMGAGLGANYAARFRGKLQIDTAGEHRFSLLLHGNARLSIDGQEVAHGLDAAGIAEVQGVITLAAGPHDVEVVYYQFYGDPALQLAWVQPGHELEIVPPGALTAEALPASRTATDDDGKFALTLPAALDGVEVRLESGKGSISIEQGNVIH